VHDLRLVHDHGAGDARRARLLQSAAKAARSAPTAGSRSDGALPTNTDGGGLSSNHPGMRGIFLVIEATKQLRGERGESQVKDCEIALVHGTGGMLGQRHSGVTMVLGGGVKHAAHKTPIGARAQSARAHGGKSGGCRRASAFDDLGRA
jgi:hypothetical protein